MIREWILVLYGTTTTPQRNDTTPAQQVSKKVGDMKKYKKIKASTIEPEKRIKQQNKVKKNNQKTSTSSAPFMTIEMSNEDLENKKTDSILQVTTSRPRVTVKVPLLKSQDNGNNMYTKKTNLKGSTYGNKVSGKLPKQANNNLFSTESTTIPKKFENYAKIEQFYPELRPIKEYNDPMFFTVTNGRKLDHENSKSSSSLNNNYSSNRRGDDENDSTPRLKQQNKKMSKGR
jgi:hypothetical protein